MRFPTRDRDSWQLRSGEAASVANPQTFWIPPLVKRQTLRRGQAAKLIFDIEGQAEDGSVDVSGERMGVLVAEQVEDTYVGILDSQPACLNPDDTFYLRRGAEVPFRAEHVIDIDDPPADYVASRLSEEPTGRWPRK